VITEKLVSDVEYQNGMKIAFKETTRLFKEGEGTPYNVTRTHRQNTGYDGRGNMIRWHDLYTPDISLYEDSGNYDISDELSGIRETDERCSGLSDKELVRWAMTEGWKEYPARLDYYGPREKQVVISDLDELGRMLEFREVETGFMDVAADQPLEERRITTSRTDIRYSAVDSDKIRSQRLITKTEKIENGQWVVEEEDNAYKFDIKYNRDGKEYSYSSFSDGEVSRVDSSEYNILGQLARQYTKIDAYSYSETFYYYDRAGNMTRTKNHYHYHKKWSEDAGKDTAHYTRHYEKTTVYDRYGEKLSEDVNEYTHVDIEKSFWTDTFGQYIIKAVGMVLSCVPTFGPFLALAFNTVVQVVQGTFNWMSFAISVATNLVKVGMRAIGDAIRGVGSDMVVLDGEYIGSSSIFSDEFQMAAFQTAFERNLVNAVVSTAITEGIYEVGERNNWDTFLTTSVATFASTAVSYGMNNDLDLTSLAFASGEALAAGAIDKFVEENPSEWAMFLAPIAKAAITEISGLGLLMKRRFDSKNLNAELGEVAHAAAFAATASTSGQRDGLRNAVPESRVKELINEGMSWLRDKGWALYSEGELTAQGLKDGMIRAIYDKSQAVLNDVGDPGTYMPDITAPTDILSAESYFDGVRNTELSPEISTLDFGTVEVAGIKGEAAELAGMAGAKVASLIIDLKTGVKFYRFDVLNDVEPVLQMIAAEPSIETYTANMDLSENGSVELMVSADGKEKYLVGDAGFGELKGAAGDWSALAGYGPGDKVEFELNLNSGDLFMFLDVSDPRGFFSRENRKASVRVERLARDISTRIGDIAALKTMEISVRINEAGAKDGEIVKATFTIDQKDISNMALARRVQGYLKSNFDGLRGGGFDVVLSMEPTKGDRVEIEGLALDLDRGSVRDTIDSLKEQTPKLRRLANEIEELVELAGGNADAFERITLKVDKRGEYVVRVKIRSEALIGLDLLMNRMSIREGSAEYSRLLKREFSYFNVDVKTGTYALDLSLRCSEFENMLMRAGEARVTARDTSGRVLSEEIRDSLGNIVVRKDYKYADTHPGYFKGDNASYGDVCRVETFTVTMPGGEEEALNRMSYGTFTGDIFTAAVSAFQPLDAFEGGTFGYVVGDLVVEMKVAMREAEGEEARAMAVTGTLPAGQMGLSVDLGMAVQGGGEERRLVYSPYEIDITLAGESMMVDGADILTVNGMDRKGEVFYTWDSEGKGGMMFLRDGAGIEVEGGGINIISGEALFFDEGMVRAPEGGMPVEGSGIPGGVDIPEDAAVTPAGDPVGDLLVPLAWAGGIAGSVEFKGSEYNIGPNGDIIPVSGEFRIEGNRVLVGGMAPVEAPVPADVGGTGDAPALEHKGMFEQLFYEDIHNILWEAVKSNIENGPDNAFDDLKTYVASTASERFGISRDLAGRYVSTVLFVAGGIMSAIGVPSMRTKHEKLGAAMFALRFAEGVPKRFLQTVMDNIGLTMDLGARALTSNKGFFGSKMFGAGMVLDEVIGMFKGGWEGFDAKIYKNVDYLVSAFKDSWTAVEGTVKLWASGGYLEKISAVGKFCGEITGLYLYTRCLRGIIKKIPGGERSLDRIDSIERSVTRKIGGKFNGMAGPFLEKFKNTKFGRKIAAIGKSLRKGADDAPGGRRGANSKKGPRSAVDVQRYNRKAQKFGIETGDPAGPGSVGTKKSGIKGAFKKRGSRSATRERTSATRERTSATRERTSATREGAGEQFNIFTGLLETAVDEFKGTVTGRTQVEDGFRNKLRSEARERAAMAFGGSGQVDILLREMGWSGKAGRGWLAAGRGIEIAAAAFLPGSVMPSLITPDNVNMTRDVVYPDLTDPTSTSANFWTGVYEDANVGYGAVTEAWESVARLVSDGNTETYTTIDKDKSVANVDMNLTYPDMPKIGKATFMPLVDVVRYYVNNQANWHTAIVDAAPKVGEVVANKDANFVFMAGVNSTGYSADVLHAMKLSLDTTKTVVVGHSAGTELAIRSTFEAKADKYIIASPRMAPRTFRNLMKEAGVSPSQVVIVSVKGDFWNWGGSYAKYAPAEWTSIHIEDGPGVSIMEPWKSHGAPIDGWLNGEKYSVRINGSNPISTDLSSAYRLKVNSD
jgi:hypothetical protein